MFSSEHAPRRIQKVIRSGAIAAFSVVIIFFVFRMVEAGSLTPSTSSPAASMRTAQEVYNVLASLSYDSSALAASRTGNAIQLVKCAINKAKAGTCP